MKSFPQYESWAESKIKGSENPSVYDWQGMTLAEASARALAICKSAREGNSSNVGLVLAFFELEKFAEYINEKFPPRISRGWW